MLKVQMFRSFKIAVSFEPLKVIGWVVAHKILVTSLEAKFLIPFLWPRLWTGTWPRACQLKSLYSTRADKKIQELNLVFGLGVRI